MEGTGHHQQLHHGVHLLWLSAGGHGQAAVQGGIDLERMGYHLCDTILDFCDPDQSKVKGP